MIEGFALTSVAISPIYADAGYRNEQISQLLFGERMIVLYRKKNGWLYIRAEWDNYEGWVKEGQVTFINMKTYKRLLNSLSLTSNDQIMMQEGQFRLSPGSSLFLLKGKSFLWNAHYTFKGKKILIKKRVFEPQVFIETCKQFLGTPYLWGGRSIAGLDCSGFSQIVYKLFNYRLPRDASQQALKGEVIDFLQEAKLGDLAFFDNEEGNINHVGILLDSNTIIHATESSGKVVIDLIDNNGIISREKKVRTHNLRLIKRYL